MTEHDQRGLTPLDKRLDYDRGPQPPDPNPPAGVDERVVAAA